MTDVYPLIFSTENTTINVLPGPLLEIPIEIFNQLAEHYSSEEVISHLREIIDKGKQKKEVFDRLQDTTAMRVYRLLKGHTWKMSIGDNNIDLVTDKEINIPALVRTLRKGGYGWPDMSQGGYVMFFTIRGNYEMRQDLFDQIYSISQADDNERSHDLDHTYYGK